MTYGTCDCGYVGVLSKAGQLRPHKFTRQLGGLKATFSCLRRQPLKESR